MQENCKLSSIKNEDYLMLFKVVTSDDIFYSFPEKIHKYACMLTVVFSYLFWGSYYTARHSSLFTSSTLG